MLPFGGTPPFKQSERDIAQARNNASVVAFRLRDLSRDPERLRSVLGGMGPQGVSDLRTTLRQYNEGGALDDVLRMLETGSELAVAPRVFATRFAGAR